MAKAAKIGLEYREKSLAKISAMDSRAMRAKRKRRKGLIVAFGIVEKEGSERILDKQGSK